MSFTYTDNSHFKRRPPCNTSRTRRYPFSFYERRDEEKKRLFLFIISSKSGFEFTNAIPTRRNTSTIDVFFSGFFFFILFFLRPSYYYTRVGILRASTSPSVSGNHVIRCAGLQNVCPSSHITPGV